MELQVQKKNGSMQPFDRNKISAGLVKSGAAIDQAESISIQVETWAQSVAQGGIVQAGEIRTKVLELLRVVNPTAAAVFESYQKPQPQV